MNWSAKTRAFVFNFFAFGIIFISLRLVINYFFPELAFLIASLVAGMVSIFISPRFAAFERNGREVVLMKWIFLKDIKEV